tara:strand:+ start:72 stop:332 length:261 start_codon:yes stop_codon:yes gene_type:complete
MGSSPISLTITLARRIISMIWTVIFVDSNDDTKLCTELMSCGTWGKEESFAAAINMFGSEVLAIIPGQQLVHFNPLDTFSKKINLN